MYNFSKSIYNYTNNNNNNTKMSFLALLRVSVGVLKARFDFDLISELKLFRLIVSEWLTPSGWVASPSPSPSR